MEQSRIHASAETARSGKRFDPKRSCSSVAMRRRSLRRQQHFTKCLPNRWLMDHRGQGATPVNLVSRRRSTCLPRFGRTRNSTLSRFAARVRRRQGRAPLEVPDCGPSENRATDAFAGQCRAERPLPQGFPGTEQPSPGGAVKRLAATFRCGQQFRGGPDPRMSDPSTETGLNVP